MTYVATYSKFCIVVSKTSFYLRNWKSEKGRIDKKTKEEHQQEEEEISLLIREVV